MSEYILEMNNITKIYANGFVANKDINIKIARGEIHALVGENGAGKSTLMKVLFGIEKATSGKILVNGKEVSINNPDDAIALGIGMVHQHFMLAPSLSILENMIMGIEPKKFGVIKYKEAFEMVSNIAEKYNFEINPKDIVGDLPVGVKQKIEILKALLRGAKILILDEPTAVLTPQETDELFKQLMILKEKGHTIIFISHKLNEIKQICDRLTVLRRGRTIITEYVDGLSEKDISRLMVGRDVVLEVDKKDKAKGETIVKISNLQYVNKFGRIKLKNINLNIHRGEILGIAGIEGNGQRELAESLTGLNNSYDGEIKILGSSIRKKSIRKIRELGVSHIPEDRMTYGVVSDATIQENLIADNYYKIDKQKRGFLKSKIIINECKKLISDYKIKCDDQFDKVELLSGGNIQKVVVARECSQNSDFIVINQPTRGIDVGAIEFVHKRIIELRDNNAILLISADLNEILELSDSLIVICEGEFVAYFNDTKNVSEEELGEYMLGIKRMNQTQMEDAQK